MRTLLPLLTLLALGCDRGDVAVPPEGVLDVRAPVGSTVRVSGQRAQVETEEPVRLVGIGPPPYQVQIDRPGERVTVLEVPGPVLDFVQLAEGPPVRGTLIPLAVRPTVAGLDALAAVAGDQVFPGERTATGFQVRVPEGVPTRLIGLWRPGGRATALGLRSLPDPRRSLGVQALAPTHPLTSETRLRLGSAPEGYLTAELTLDGLRTGLVLGAGVAARQEGLAVARPAALPGAGLWLEAAARSPGFRHARPQRRGPCPARHRRSHAGLGPRGPGPAAAGDRRPRRGAGRQPPADPLGHHRRGLGRDRADRRRRLRAEPALARVRPRGARRGDAAD
ncbi:MAG: hypothetical protein R3F60_19090 [bacterium]